MNNLPIELLEQICTILCPHCTDINSDDHFSCSQALASLSRTTRLLRAIAQPILFHHLKVNKRSTCALLRMQYERPRLASSVKQLSPLWQQSFFDGSDEDHQVLQRAARDLLLDIDGDADFEEWYGDNHQKPFLTDLTVALLPNLEAFVAEIEYDFQDEELVTFNRFWDSRFKKLKVQNNRPGLPNIRALGLLNAAPNLERLVFDGTHGVGTMYEEWTGDIERMAPGLRNLRLLSITISALGNSEDGFEFRQLRRIVQLCTRMEVFRFHSIGPYLGELDEGHFPPGKFH